MPLFYIIYIFLNILVFLIRIRIVLLIFKSFNPYRNPFYTIRCITNKYLNLGRKKFYGRLNVHRNIGYIINYLLLFIVIKYIKPLAFN